MADLAVRYLEEHIAVRCKPKTQRTARSVVNRHIVPTLGRLPLQAVERSHVMAMSLSIIVVYPELPPTLDRRPISSSTTACGERIPRLANCTQFVVHSLSRTHSIGRYSCSQLIGAVSVVQVGCFVGDRKEVARAVK